MTLAEWLDAREPAPPHELSARLRDALRDAMDDDARLAPDVCIDAAEELLRDVLARGCTTRDSALSLLTADALLTYAFEAGADSPDTLDARADGAIRRIASVGDLGGRSSVLER